MEKSPLYRKVNTTAHGANHSSGGDYRDQRKKKAGQLPERIHQGMHGTQRRGLDYTPLFRFLLSRVGREWNDVYSEAVSRLVRPEPIFWLVALRLDDEQDYVRIGESSYFSGLRVDSSGILQVVNAEVGPETLTPFCKCCTHTFNGVRFTKAFNSDLAT